MSPTCSRRDLVGRKTRSAAARTTRFLLLPGQASARPRDREAYAMTETTAKGEPALGRSPGWYVPGALEARRAHGRRPRRQAAVAACLSVLATLAINAVAQRSGGVADSKTATPAGCDPAYVHTRACGPPGVGKTKTATWSVPPVQAASYTISYSVAAGLNGTAKAVDANRNQPKG